MKAKGRRESEVSAGISAYLAMRGDIFWWRQNVSAGVSPSGRFMRSGLRGTPDFLVVKNGILYGLEVKREAGGVASDDQEIWGANLTAAGGVYAVVRSVEEAATVLGLIEPRIYLRTRKKVYPR